jgi:hypothetical protein
MGTKPGKKQSLKDNKYQEIKKILLHQREALLSGAGVALSSLPSEAVFPELGDQASA